MSRGGELEADAAAFGDALAADWGGAIDVALLGVGPDGHVASLFPGRPAPAGLSGAVRGSPKPPPERLTLTPRALEAADCVLLARGAAKAPALARALAGDGRLPLGALRPRGEWIWYIDEAAASGLPLEV